MANLLWRFIPSPFRSIAERVCSSQIEVIDLLLGRRDELTPPRRMQFDGGSYKTVGREFLRYFIDLGQLKPGDRVLDVGSGIGRMAVPLTRYLGQEGGYEGFSFHFDSIGGDGRFEQLPLLAASDLMADGYGYAAEGDTNTASLMCAAQKMIGDAQDRKSVV